MGCEWRKNVKISAGVVGVVTVIRAVGSRKKSKAMVVDFQGTMVKVLSREEREKQGRKEHLQIAQEELSRAWMYKPEARERVKEYFEMMQDQNWKLEKVNGDMETWRLPGEQVHRIMGVKHVNATPSLCMQYFEDPKAVFTKLFPKIDLMFSEGKVLNVGSKGQATCYGVFKMPMPVGNQPARGIRSRDFLWDQRVTQLNTGNVLVTANSLKDSSHVPTKKGCVRGMILTSGYYGRTLPENKEVSKVWYIVQADPKGCLPKWLVNLASSKQADNVYRLSEMFKNVE